MNLDSCSWVQSVLITCLFILSVVADNGNQARVVFRVLTVVSRETSIGTFDDDGGKTLPWREKAAWSPGDRGGAVVRNEIT